VPSAGLLIETLSCAPFGSVVLFVPANAGVATSAAKAARAAASKTRR
jgi:hypothetical protein